MSKLLDQGGFGCIFFPSLTCKGTTKTTKKSKNTVSKVQLDDFAAENEIYIGNLISKIPKYKEYFLPVLSSCPLNISNVDSKLKSECKIIKKRPNKQFIIMNMDYLENISYDKYFILSRSKDDVLHRLLYSYETLIKSLQILNQNNIVHHDLKLDNILFRSKDLKPIIIDFGISIDMSNVNSTNRELLGNYFYVDAPDYYIWPIEVHILNYILVNKPNYTNDDFLSQTQLYTLGKKFVNENVVLDNFSEHFINKYLIQLYKYIKPFSQIPIPELIDKLLSTFKKWDVYSLNVIYIRLISKIYKRRFPLITFFKSIIELFVINILPNPDHRYSWEESLNKLKIIKQSSSEKDIKLSSINI